MNLLPADAIKVVVPVVDVLEHLQVPYHIGGSLAGAVYGMPRGSADVDLVAELRPEHVDPFVAQLQDDYYVARDSVFEAIRRRTSFNLIHTSTMMKVDVFCPEAVSFAVQEQARARRETLEVEANARVFLVKAPEDLILRKLHWYRAGGESSERQWSDVVGLLKVQSAQLDRDYLAIWAGELEVRDLLDRACTEADG